jgi:hypothetical protein
VDNGEDVEGRGHRLIEVLTQHQPGETLESHEISVMSLCLQTKIRTSNRLNLMQE